MQQSMQAAQCSGAIKRYRSLRHDQFGMAVRFAAASTALAEINVATFRMPMADPVNAEFIANLAYENPNTAINMSVWSDKDALADFVYHNAGHREIMRRRKEWFDRMEFHLALWWAPAGHRPTVIEGKERLQSLSRVGPSAYAFLFNSSFPAPDALPIPPRLDKCA